LAAAPPKAAALADFAPCLIVRHDFMGITAPFYLSGQPVLIIVVFANALLLSLCW
jgi:hypothetical protein